MKKIKSLLNTKYDKNKGIPKNLFANDLSSSFIDNFFISKNIPKKP